GDLVGLAVDLDARGRVRAKHYGRDGENAAAAAEVEHAVPGKEMALQQGQSGTRGAVLSTAERRLRVEHDERTFDRLGNRPGRRHGEPAEPARTEAVPPPRAPVDVFQRANAGVDVRRLRARLGREIGG